MSITVMTLYSKTPTKFFSTKLPRRLHQNSLSLLFTSPSLSTKTSPSNKLQITNNYHVPFQKSLNCNGFRIQSSGFIVKAENESGIVNNLEEEKLDARGQSSMPERFRYLTKEAPEDPVRWPWLIVTAFLLYAWRTVLWELCNWKRVVGSIFQFLIYIPKFLLALIFCFIGDPLTYLIRGLENTIYTTRTYYSSIVAYAPIQELTTIIMLTSATLAIAEATVPDSVTSQPYLLTFAGLIGFAAVKNYISELFFWTLLVGMFGFARLVKKRDYVTSALPVAAVLAAVGEPWVRVLVMGLFLALAIFHHSKQPVNLEENEDVGAGNRVPVPLVCAAFAIGVRVAAKWAGYRHLTWMVV